MVFTVKSDEVYTASYYATEFSRRKGCYVDVLLQQLYVASAAPIPPLK